MAQSVDYQFQRKLGSFAGLDDKCTNVSVWSFLFFSQVTFTAFGLFALGFDLNFGLSHSNSKFVSFCHSLHVCYSYLELRKTTHDPGIAWKRFLAAVVSKFGGGTIISFVLWRRPVLLKSFRHIITFAAAFCIAEQPLFKDFVRTWYLNLVGGRFFRQWTCRMVRTRNTCRWFWTNRGFAVSCLAAVLLFYGTVIQSTFDPLAFKVLTLLIFYLQYIGADLTMKKVLPEIAQKVQKRLSEYDKRPLRNIQSAGDPALRSVSLDDSAHFEHSDEEPLNEDMEPKVFAKSNFISNNDSTEDKKNL